MIFLHPNFLIFMLIPLIILAYLIITNKKTLQRVFSNEQIKRLVIKQNPFGHIGQNILLFTSLLLFIIALSRPVIPKKEITLSTKPIDIAILLDISNSMNATDLYPNRLTFAKEKIIELLSSIKYANISLYAYSDNLFMIAPKTYDSYILKYLIKNFNPHREYRNSSNLYNAISHIKEKNIIIFTDGEHIHDIKKIKSLNKNISIYLTANRNGAPIKLNDRYLTNKNEDIIISKPPQDIKELGYVENFSYKKIDFNKLVPKSSDNSSKTFDTLEKKELFYYPLYLGLILLIINFFSLPKFKYFTFILFFSFLPIKSNALVFDFYYLKKAKEAYNLHDYNKSIKYYKKVLSSDTKPQLYYNLGNCYYKKQNYQEAIKMYKRVNSQNKNLIYKKYFNLGNSYFMLKKYNSAYNYYLLAQKIKNSKKVEYNIKITRKFIKEKKQSNFYQKSAKAKFKKQILDSLKQKSIMIPITNKKVNRDEISW